MQLSVFLATLVAFTTSSNALYLSPPQHQERLGIPGTLHTSTDTIVDPCTLAESPSANASIQLSNWVQCQINGFYPFPANTHWVDGHVSSFSKDIRFTFNDTHYDFDGSLRLYQTFNATLSLAFAPFKHGFLSALGVPNANGDRGGFVYVIGWAGGYNTYAKREVWYTNAAFAVVREEEGKRKIVEFRESSNIPYRAALPEQTGWSCSFPKGEGKETGELKK